MLGAYGECLLFCLFIFSGNTFFRDRMCGCREDVFPRLGQSEDFRMHFELGTSQKCLTSSLRGNLGVVNCGATSGFVEKIGPRDEIQTPIRWKQGCRKTAERQDRESVCIQLLGTSTLLLLLQLV